MLDLIPNLEFWIGLHNPNAEACTDLLTCTDKLFWLDDGSPFTFDASFMDNLSVDLSNGGEFISLLFTAPNTWTIQAKASNDPLHAVCQVALGDCLQGKAARQIF